MGAHVVHGAIWHLWTSNGREKSCLGYPVSDEQQNGTSGRIQFFQHGRVLDPGRRCPLVLLAPAGISRS